MNALFCSVAGYRMIESLRISNFRCFDKLQLDRLKRVNILTGTNASGKSALIDAIYLGAGASGSALQNIGRANAVQAQLMMGPAGPVPFVPQQSLEASFDQLFPSSKKPLSISASDHAKLIEIVFTDSEHTEYSLEISYQNRSDGKPVAVVSQASGLSQNIPITLKRTKTSSGGKPDEDVIYITENQFGQWQHPLAAPFGPATMIFPAGMNYSEVDNVVWFSQLKQRGETKSLMSFIKKEFPFITDLSVLAPSGSSSLYATMEEGAVRPVSSVSEGIYKIISIILGCAHTRNGVILIDEIENGIFYEKYQSLWEMLYKFALHTGNQIFVSTHSAECLNQLVPVAKGAVDDFCLLRTVRRNDSSSLVQHVSGKAFIAALKGENEVRGASLALQN